MTAIAGAWLNLTPHNDLLQSPIQGAVDFAECLEACTGVPGVECGVQCARSLDVHSRGLPVYVPFRAPNLPQQFVGFSLYQEECSQSSFGGFIPNPASPTIMDFSARNP
jgi:hypothetical protein